MILGYLYTGKLQIDSVEEAADIHGSADTT